MRIHIYSGTNALDAITESLTVQNVVLIRYNMTLVQSVSLLCGTDKVTTETKL
jgi:hypothetical protein